MCDNLIFPNKEKSKFWWIEILENNIFTLTPTYYWQIEKRTFGRPVLLDTIELY